MFVDKNIEPKKKIYRIGTMICTVIVILAACYFGYFKYQQNKFIFQSPEGFSVKVNTTDINDVGTKWLEAYTE